MRLNPKKRKRIRRTSHSGSLLVLQAKTAVFVTFSDGIRRTYGNRDQDPSYGRVRIPDPRTVSYVNLFVNAVHQRSGVYRVSRGKLKLRSPEVPEKGGRLCCNSSRYWESTPADTGGERPRYADLDGGFF